MTTTTYDFKAASSELYDHYGVTIHFREWLCGGVPRNKELIHQWVKARTGFDDQVTEAQTKEAVASMVEDVADKSWIGFESDANGLFVRARQVKAMFRESMTLLGIAKTKIGSKQILQHGFEVKSNGEYPDRIHFDKAKPDGMDESAIHVMTAQGPRTALRRMDYVDQAVIKFELWVLKTATAEKRHLGEKDIARMLAHAQENGLGASRSQGYGKFDVVEFGLVG